MSEPLHRWLELRDGTRCCVYGDNLADLLENVRTTLNAPRFSDLTGDERYPLLAKKKREEKRDGGKQQD